MAVDDVSNHPRFKYFKESGEEEYHSFLGVPLVDRGVLQGVLVVQTKDPRVYRENEIRMLAEAAGQVAPVVSEARTLDRFIAPAQERLWALARNVWWSWDHDCISLFRDLNPTRWRQLNQNPISLLSEMPLGEIERRATELVLHSRINYVYRRQQEYLNADRTWGAANAGVLRPRPVAYFSAEFGLHESLPIYSGGLGVLAGDHIKSASDLDIPLIGIGLFYGQGYFLQRLDQSGWQKRRVSANRCEPVAHAAGHRRKWRAGGGRNCHARRLDPGQGMAREGGPHRSASAGLERGRQCAGRSRHHFTALRRRRAHAHSPGAAAGHWRLPRAEGHGDLARRSASERGTQRLRGFRSDTRPHGGRRARLSRTAASLIPREVIFTTHTPVPAGHDRFSADLMEEHLGPLREQLGISHENLMGFGREYPTDYGEPFCMTVLGLKLARRVNAVSSLHGEVSRAMWKGLYPDRPEDAVPIGHITNGVHVPSWLAPQMCRLYDRHLGVGWQRHSGTAQDLGED